LPGAKFTLHPPSLALSCGNVTAQHSSSGRKRNFAALSTGRHLYLAGQPSRWTLAHILVHFSCYYVLIWLAHSVIQHRYGCRSYLTCRFWLYRCSISCILCTVQPRLC